MTWLPKDARLVLASRALRAFAYGFLTVLLGLYLAQLGFGAVALGGLLSVAGVGTAMLMIAFSATADRFGRRRLLQVSALMMAASGLIFAIAPGYPALLLAAFSGTVATSTGEESPFFPIEQAILPQTVDDRRRNQVFGLYNTVGAIAGALGALAAGLPAVFRSMLGLSGVDSNRAMLLLYALVGLLVFWLASALSNRVELAPTGGPPRLFAMHRSRGTVLRLASLFALDAAASGFLLQSMVALWFNIRFGATETVLGPMFAAVGLMQAVSYMVAARLADRFGLINTMVWTHLPSNVLLMLIPLAPTLELAIVLFVVRHGLAQMDVPARQSYTMAVVQPDERPAAAGVTAITRPLGHAATPLVAGYAMQTVALGLPFVISGLLKIVYDLALYAAFRSVPAPEEAKSKPGGRL